ncbi:MAG: 16S rRNA (uracil(1498)-N(3))-methyltransferase [Planctomycetia bacterium]|nr:16S rRNA (uracil(1498)-N(3))-methyltransferase [Planctomycetia bacterium]
MSRRFFVRGPLKAGPLRLVGGEAHHLVRVLRIGVGQSVVLFDGHELEAPADVMDVAPGSVDLTVHEPRKSQTEPAVELVLAAAVPKGDRFAWLIEKATELGVRRFVPLVTERSVVVPGAGKLEKMRRTIIEASKQSRRTRLMDLAEPLEWKEFAARELTAGPACVAHPSGAPFDIAPFRAEVRAVAAVGPEGGFTDAELELATRRSAALVSLGPGILRIETAALALAALITTCR